MRYLLNPIFKQIDTLPALPSTVGKVMKVTANPESSANDLIRAILPDQSMCTAILKLANSAFFGLPRSVKTIEKAVMVLGFDEVRNIILAKAVFNSFQNVYRRNSEVIGLFWEHSFLCGLAAKIIAEEELLSPSELFVGGLTHDIGKLVMLMSLGSDYADILELSHPTEFKGYLNELERFSLSHDDVAMRLLNRWLFPVSLINAIGYHHRPQDSPTDPVPAIIIQIADILSLMQLNPKASDCNDLMTIIEDFLPEIKLLWQQNKLDWNGDDFVRWQNKLRESSINDRAVLTVFSP